MDLHSGFPFWLVKNGLLADYPILDQDLLNEEIVIIGSGISGALAAHALCTAGFHCTMIDKRILSSGSTWASTAQVNYEVDFSMHQLTRMYNETFAVAVYEATLASIDEIQNIARSISLDASLESRSSIYLASDKKGVQEVKEEYILRRRHHFPVDLLDREDIKGFRIQKTYECALYHQYAAQFDAYQFTVGLIKHHTIKGNLTVYTRTCIDHLDTHKQGVTLKTNNGHIINARYVVCAPGYESAQFLPKKVMDLHSTYALVTQPLQETDLWKERCLIWESLRPYFYLRTTLDNRIMMGGKDVPFKDEEQRDQLMKKKCGQLLQDCTELFPHLKLKADFVWCGTFGESHDGLPFIGNYPGIPNVFFALGYGGNGTTFSIIAAELICNHLTGKPDHREQLFSFTR